MKFGALFSDSEREWKRKFEQVPLQEGVNREQAFRLVMLTLDYFDNKYLSDFGNHDDLDETYLRDFLKERNSFLSMILFGIKKEKSVK